ncbi:MAG TPA: WcbI family polysaccharide biosynthesis putative acetyltransferase [Candidatus Acidoferrales bacterium]|nr:WcbI family polysaccharide biosynthesis putative acetyltransferase [Candidatus Acidoferrales bacterium]
MSLPVLLIYGNCQADTISALLEQSSLSEFLEVAYLPSFDHPIHRRELPDEILDRCTILWEQYDYVPFPYARQLAGRVHATIFPALDLNLLWPFTCNNPYNRPEPPRYPSGRFFYGDRAIVAGLRAGLDEEAILERALRAWDEHPVDLDRLLEIDRSRLRARDMHCDIRIADRTLERFIIERCFFTRDHPTLSMLVDMIDRLVERTCAFEPRLTRVTLGGVQTRFTQEPLGDGAVPIHPAVAGHFGLAWYEPQDMRSYYTAMIRHGLSVRDACTP